MTFSKRRSGFFKKGSELAILCGARVVLVVFSEVGNVFALGSPSADAVLDGGTGPDEGEREALEGMCRAREEAAERVAAETAGMDSIGDKVAQAQVGRRSWWEADVEMLGEAELPEFARALKRFRDDVRRHADKLLSAPPAAAAVAAPAPCTTATAAVSPGTHGDPSASDSWAY